MRYAHTRKAELLNEALIRLTVFAAVLLIMMAAEAMLPRRDRKIDRLIRWPGNFGVAMLSTVLVRLAIPTSAVGVAVALQTEGIGLLNIATLPLPLATLISFIALDFVIYWQHRLFHAVPTLWRLHRMHHTDLEFDVTTALRFHPFEILLSMLLKLGAILLLGAPAIAVIIFEIVLNASAMFNHANVRLPAGLDRLLRQLIVTPDMHRVHHSTVPEETNANFGFCLSCWDRWFDSYVAQPQFGHKQMQIGLAEFPEREISRLDQMLINPLVEREPR